MNDRARQLALPREPMPLDERTIQAPKDFIKAFTMAADLGGLDDQQAAAAAGMDPATWSGFKQGTRGIKPLEFNPYLDQVGNNLPLAYWAYTRGFALTPLESEYQRQLRLKDEKLARIEHENAVLRSVIHAGRSA